MVVETKISKGYQTVMPAQIRKKFDIEPGDVVVWSVVGDEVYIRIRRSTGEDPLKQFIGNLLTKEETDATKEIDDLVYRGE